MSQVQNTRYASSSHCSVQSKVTNSNSSLIVSLQQARLAQEELRQSNNPSLRWRTSTPPAPYLLKPCQVITLPVKGSASLGKK
jgi:hypothetical protein